MILIASWDDPDYLDDRMEDIYHWLDEEQEEEERANKGEQPFIVPAVSGEMEGVFH